MAKFAQVGYGHDGRGGMEQGGYTYVVNDNVRTGDMLVPLVKHAGNGNVFVTTGKVLTNKELQEVNARKEALKLPERVGEKGISRTFSGAITKDGKAITQDDLTNAYRQSDLGVKRAIIGKGQKIKDVRPDIQLEARNRALAIGNTEMLDKGESPEFSKGPKTQEALDYTKESYDSYAKQFTK